MWRETGDDAHGPRLLASTRRSRHPAARWETWLSVTTRGSVSGPRRTLPTAAAPCTLAIDGATLHGQLQPERCWPVRCLAWTGSPGCSWLSSAPSDLSRAAHARAPQEYSATSCLCGDRARQAESEQEQGEWPAGLVGGLNAGQCRVARRGQVRGGRPQEHARAI